jgi:hypothetical protein
MLPLIQVNLATCCSNHKNAILARIISLIHQVHFLIDWTCLLIGKQVNSQENLKLMTHFKQSKRHTGPTIWLMGIDVIQLKAMAII